MGHAERQMKLVARLMKDNTNRSIRFACVGGGGGVWVWMFVGTFKCVCCARNKAKWKSELNLWFAAFDPMKFPKSCELGFRVTHWKAVFYAFCQETFRNWRSVR